MATLNYIHSFLIAPGKNVPSVPVIDCASIPKRGQVYEVLRDVFDRSPAECDIELFFRPDANGQQNNQVRTWVNNYAQQPSTTLGMAIALHLQNVTTRRSGLSLLFLMHGTDDQGCRVVVISRFPATGGIIADTITGGLFVEFNDHVFMKNSTAYKSAFFYSGTPNGDFQDCRVVDRQKNSPGPGASYWIEEFLTCDLRTTSLANTRLLAGALEKAAQNVNDPRVKQQIMAAAMLMPNQDGVLLSPASVCRSLGLGDLALGALEAAMPRPDLMDEQFIFSADAFEKFLPYRIIMLDNDVSITGPNKDFNDHVRAQVVDGTGRTQYLIEGQVTEEKFRKRR